MDTTDKIMELEKTVAALTLEVDTIDTKAEVDKLAALQATVDALKTKITSQEFQDMKAHALEITRIEQDIYSMRQELAIIKSGESGPPTNYVEAMTGGDKLE
jgi:hypothetical protein